jgi:hypothetical protein
MNSNWNVTFIDLQNLVNITKSDKTHMLKYLNQFQELIPLRVASLKESLAAEDRKLTRQILHQMSPQLQFFGVPGILTPIRRLEHEYLTMPLGDLKILVNEILIKLDGAIKDVENLVKNKF